MTRKQLVAVTLEELVASGEREHALWLDGPDSEARRASQNRPEKPDCCEPVEPDYRAMWIELEAQVAALEEKTAQTPRWSRGLVSTASHLGAFKHGVERAFEAVCGLMGDIVASHRCAAEHVAWAMELDPTHTPAVRDKETKE